MATVPLRRKHFCDHGEQTTKNALFDSGVLSHLRRPMGAEESFCHFDE
jgi:hypothetical protein